jgi:hypothetical protein
MKIFFDTNVLAAAFISHGACAELFDHCLENHLVYTSDFVVEELLEKLAGKFHFTNEKVLWACNHLRINTTLTAESTLTHRLCRDKDDDHILAASIHAQVDCIISGDKDLLDMKKVQHISIVKPADFWKFEEDFKAKA